MHKAESPYHSITPMDVDALPVSAEFKKEVFRSVLSITAFILVYLTLLSLAIILVVSSVYGGISLILNIPRIQTVLLGVGLIGLGIMVFVFIIKFLFARSTADNTDSIEITKEDQPELVAFIYQIANETKTPLPKKIYLSGDVNACVFYNSSFWSMFLPVKKNLKIGLGLVNSLNVSELKAVIAHEFGHFSQRSMKVGSFVYNVNHIIYDILFNNNNYYRSLQSFGNITMIFSVFAQLTVKIIQGIQWVLRQMYGVVNKSHLSLSRQMEFHADLIAASVGGGNNLVSALQKIEYADSCMNTAMEACDRLWKENKMFTNIYENHRIVIKHVAQVNGYQVKDGLPVLDVQMKNRPVNRVNFRDQWTSHPTSEERKAYLEQFELYSGIREDSAWVLFTNTTSLQQQFTKKLYQDLTIDDQKLMMDTAAFEEMYITEAQSFALPKIYKGFYDNRLVTIFNVHESFGLTNVGSTIEELLSEENIELPKKIQSLQYDIEILKAIENKEVDTKTFDFDGQKYIRGEAASIRLNLEKELEAITNALTILDKDIAVFFYKTAMDTSIQEGMQLKHLYSAYFEHRQMAETYLKSLNELLKTMQPVYSGQTLSLEEINHLIDDLKKTGEVHLKEQLKKWMDLGVFEKNVVFKETTKDFIEKDYQYFTGNSFIDNELFDLKQIIEESWTCVHIFLFENFKKILETQIAIMHPMKVQR